MKSDRVQLSNQVSVSKVIHGQMRLFEWGLSDQGLVDLINQCLEAGVTTFDHADIYGNYECEKKFGEALTLDTSLRDQIEIVTKCGIKLLSDKFPDRTVKHYDLSKKYIINSVEQSLKNLNTDRIDVLLLHRPSPLWSPEEIASAFNELKNAGKVLEFGVSNFNAQQFELLNSYLDVELVTNQIEVSPVQLKHFDDGTIDLLTAKSISSMVWSPLAGGSIFHSDDERSARIRNALLEIAGEFNTDQIDLLIYSWLYKHPGSFLPIVGSGRIERIKSAIAAQKINLSTEQWFKVWVASTGNDVA